MSAPLELLFVDDDPDIRTIVLLSLGLDPAISVRSAASGAEALALLGQARWRPQAILLDVMMPEMDGLALADTIRRLPGCDTLPLLFMTARVREADIAFYRAQGAAGVIVKPFDPLRLAAELRRLLGQPARAPAPTPEPMRKTPAD